MKGNKKHKKAKETKRRGRGLRKINTGRQQKSFLAEKRRDY